MKGASPAAGTARLPACRRLQVAAASHRQAATQRRLASLVPQHGSTSCTTPGSSHRRTPLLCSAAAGAASFSDGRGEVTFQAAAGSQAETSAESGTAKLLVYILFWYASNVAFNIVNKQTLNAFPMPYAIATWQLTASVLCGAVLWITKTIPRPQVTGDFAKALLPVALFHTLGHVSACVSFSLMAVSFSHIVKSAEPVRHPDTATVFSVLLSWPLLGKTYPWYVWLSLVPIVAGCSLSAAKEVTFAWPGFNNAMASNIGMVVRNILSKKLMGGYKDVGGINLFVLISLFSLVFCIPLALVMESHMWPAAIESAKASVGTGSFARLMLSGGLLYHLYNQASYMVLDLPGITPVTLSVGNTMKRVAVVASSVLFFKNPVGLLNWIGSGVAIAGTGLYGLASDKAAQEGKAA